MIRIVTEGAQPKIYLCVINYHFELTLHLCLLVFEIIKKYEMLCYSNFLILVRYMIFSINKLQIMHLQIENSDI